MKYIILTFLIFLWGCESNNSKENISEALSSISEKSLIENIKILSSDDFLGRKPSTSGEERTINFLQQKFAELGLKPGNNGSFFQEVPLIEIDGKASAVISILTPQGVVQLKHATEYVAISPQMTEEVTINNSEMIFAGYGIIAPEYNWNDYEGINVKDKIVIVLVNDPGYATKDSLLFTGNEMTYYGRWTYKYEEAARQGAAGVLIIHEDGAAGYPWEVVKNGWTGSEFYLDNEDNNLSKCKAEGWMTTVKAKEIFEMCGLNFDSLSMQAARQGFKPVKLNAQTSIKIENKISSSISHNVIALLPGSGRSDEYIIYTAHWDHFGVDSTITDGDNIFNGARDNATGTAALIEIARAFTQLERKQDRSVIFLAVTAEEQGLLGSAYYAKNPIFSLDKTIAVINMDALNIFGRVKDITIIGYGKSELDDYVWEAANEEGRIVASDPEPEKGGYFRSDHFSFAKKGVPSIYAKGGVQHIENGEKWMRERVSWWTKVHYHKPSDEFDPDYWDAKGMIDDIRLLFRAGYKISVDDKFPNWHNGSEFKAKRDSMLADN